MKALKFIGVAVVAIVAAYFVAAVALIYWPADIFKDRSPEPTPVQADYPHTEQSFVMRDGKRLFSRAFGQSAETAVVLVHGFGASSDPYQRAASAWAEASGARVFALDLRGHGRSDGKQGRLDYYGQYEIDLADVIAALREQGARKIILAGHSMGGGVVLRYAQKPEAEPDAYLLIAPLLGNGAPTAPAAGGAAPIPSNLFVRTPRIIGAAMFSLLRIHAFDDLPVLYLNQTPPMTYGLTAVISMAPVDYRAAFRAIGAPLLLIAGSKDEVFRAAAYADVVKQYSGGRSVLVDGATHVSVLADPAAVGEIKNFVEAVEGR